MSIEPKKSIRLEIIQPVEFTPSELQAKIAESLGLALAMAAFLALSVDIFLKRRLASDAVKEALGYALDSDIRDSIRWLYGLSFLCEKSDINVRVVIHDNDMVRLTITTQRKFKNITDRVQKIRPRMEVKESLLTDYPTSMQCRTYLLSDPTGIDI